METKIIKDKITQEELKLIAYKNRLSHDFQERWFKMSFVEQMGNIGSEVGRAAKWQGRDESSFWGAVTRALELLDLTRMDRRWRNRRVEIDRAREVFSDAVLGGHEYHSFLPNVERYFMQFAPVSQGPSLRERYPQLQ